MSPMRLSLTALAAAVLMAAPAHAEWPNDRPIEIIVGFAPGGPSDVVARALAPSIAKNLGPSAAVVIINRPGAGGELGVANLARARPDGYTTGIVNLPGYYFLPMFRKTAYELKDLSLVARVVSDPQIMVVRKDSKFTDLKQIVEAVKAAPSSLSIGNNGIGTSGHLGVVSLEKAAGVKFNSIPYNGSAQQKTAIAGGQLDIAMLAASEIPDPDQEPVPVRILAQFAKEPSPAIAKVPTTYSQGFPTELYSERGFAVPKGMNPAIQKHLQDAIEAAMKDPEFAQRDKYDAPFLAFMGGAPWQASMEESQKLFADVAREFANK